MTKRPARRGLVPILRFVAPFVVSAVLLGYLFARIDLDTALGYFRWPVVASFIGPLLAFNLFTVGIEARCLNRVAAASEGELRLWTAARIKAASYLLGLLNFGLGAIGLSFLLRRRAEVGLADAAGMVFLIALFDLGSVLGLVGLGVTFLNVDTFGIRVGLVTLLIAAIVAGFAFLRAPIRMGPLDPLRELEIFRAPRTAPSSLMLELAMLRILFVGSYVALAAALFWSFGIEVGLVRLALNVAIMLVVSILPVAAGGLGTGQIVFVELFRGLAPPAELLAASIVFSIGLMLTRALLGLCFAPEYSKEALAAARSGEEERGDQ
jgi:hypothetical protein